MDRAAVEVVAMDGIDHGTDHAFAVDALTGIALGQHFGTHRFRAIADHGEIAGDDAGGRNQVLVGEVLLARVDVSPDMRASVLVADTQRADNFQIPVAAEKGIGFLGHGNSPD